MDTVWLVESYDGTDPDDRREILFIGSTKEKAMSWKVQQAELRWEKDVWMLDLNYFLSTYKLREVKLDEAIQWSE